MFGGLCLTEARYQNIGLFNVYAQALALNIITGLHSTSWCYGFCVVVVYFLMEDSLADCIEFQKIYLCY